MKILMVLTSHSELGNTGKKTEFWIEEFAAPYYAFKEAGAIITIASPIGGQPPIDPSSDTPDNQTPATIKFKADTELQKALSNTKKYQLFWLMITTAYFIPADMALYGI